MPSAILPAVIRCLLLLFHLLLAFPLLSQEIRQNEKGEKIIVYPDGSWRYYHQRNVAGGEYPVLDSHVAPLENPALVTEEDARKVAGRRVELSREAATIAQLRAKEAQEQRTRLEQALAQSSQQANAEPEQTRRLRLRLEAARATEDAASREAVLAQQEFAKAEAFTQKGNILEEFKQTQVASPPSGLVSTTQELTSQFFLTLNPAVAAFSPFPNFMPLAAPPGDDCHFDFEGTDAQTGRRRRDAEKQLLFTHTDDRLRLFLKDKEYLRCEGYLSAIDGGYRVLTLEFTFAYPNAREAYGFIEKNSMLSIRLINGDFVNLRAGTFDRGSYDTQRDLLTYRVQYPIDFTLLSFLKRSEIDNFRVYWSSGFEAYPVYNVDFFIQQLRCLE